MCLCRAHPLPARAACARGQRPLPELLRALRSRSVYESKGWSTVASFTDHKAAVTGVGFGRSASLLVATAADGIVKHFGAAP